jgi:hypothetical protein
MSAPGPAEGAQQNAHLDTTRWRCACKECRPAIPLGRLADDPVAAAAVVRAAWAARAALAAYRSGGRP